MVEMDLTVQEDTVVDVEIHCAPIWNLVPEAYANGAFC